METKIKKEYHFAVFLRIETPLCEEKSFQDLMKLLNLKPVLTGRAQVATGIISNTDGEISEPDLEKMKNMTEDVFNKHFAMKPAFKELNASFEVEWIK